MSEVKEVKNVKKKRTINKKYTYEEVYEIFKSNGYDLLDKKYVNSNTKMTCIAIDGYRFFVSLDMLSSGGSPSIFCRGNPYTDLNIDNFLLIKGDKYKRITCNITNTKQEIDISDDDGYKYRMQLSSLIYSYNGNSTRVGNDNYWSIYNINRYLKEINSKDILLTEEFVKQSAQLDWICEHGHTFNTNWNNYYTKGFRCRECANIARMYTFEQCEEMVSKREGYKLLDMERRKNTIDTDIIYYYMEHECGHRYWVYKQEFDSGTSCEPCAKKAVGLKRRDSEDLVRRKIEDETDFEYKYIKSRFVRNRQGLKRRINIIHKECGKEYWSDYSNWNYGHRCNDCCPRDVPTVPYEEWQDRINNQNIYNFELLDVYYKMRSDGNRNDAWLKIKCNDCGNEINRVGGGWKNGCPNCTVSKGEDMVRKLLNEYNVKHTPQMKYEGLVGVGGGKLSYDFYLDKYNLLIEYQGEFHDGTDRMPDKSYLPTQQEHDRRKREYAEQQGIGLLEIWYWDFDNIESILKEKLQLN